MHLLGILCLVAAAVALPVSPDSPTLLNLVAVVLPDLEYRTNIQKAATYNIPGEDKINNNEVEKNNFKIASVLIAPPPELPPFDYITLRKQKAAQKQKSYDSLKSEAEKYKKDKETKLAASVIKLQDSVAIPSPPQLPAFDYSISLKQKFDQKSKSENSAQQEADRPREKEAAIVNLEKEVHGEVPSSPIRISDSVATFPVSEEPLNMQNVATDSVSMEEKKEDEEVKNNTAKVVLDVIPPPPELAPLDYSSLEKRIYEQKIRSDDFMKKEAEISKKEKETINLDIQKPIKIELPSNPTTLTDSVTTIQNSVVIPSPPQLPPFDYSILLKQKSDQKSKSEYSAQKEADRPREKEAVIVNLEKEVQVEVPSRPITISDSLATFPITNDLLNIQNVATDAVSMEEKKDDEEIKKNTVKVVLDVMPPPPELTPLDYASLEKRIYEQKIRSRDFMNKEAEKTKKEKETINLDIQKPITIDLPSNPTTLTKSVTTIQNSVVIPSPPQLPPFDYSILLKQRSDQKSKSEYSAQKEADRPREKEAVIVNLEKEVQVEVPSRPITISDSLATFPITNDLLNIQNVATDAVSMEEKKDDEEIKKNTVKVVLDVMPPPPELAPLDYASLEKRIYEQKIRSRDFMNKEAEKTKKEKKTINLDIQKPITIDLPSNPTTLTKSVTTIQNSVIIPSPPQLPPFDYSILIKKKSDQKSKSDYSAQQEANRPREKEAVIVNLEKEVQVKVPSSPITISDSVATFPVPEEHLNNQNVATDAVSMQEKKDDEEVKKNTIKVVLDVIPPPPELAPLDYSILGKDNFGDKESSGNFMKKYDEKSNEERDKILLENTFECNVKQEPKLVKESKFVEDSKAIEQSRPIKECKSKEEFKNEAIKPSGHIPVLTGWKLPTAPFFKKLISNYPTLRSFDLDWPFRRPSSILPRIIYPEFDIDYTY